MKKLFGGSPHTKFIATATAFIGTIAIATSARGAQLQEARVTQVVNDVKLLLEQGAPRPAVVSDLIRRGNAVRTGTQSRSELTFADLTITRLGANTIFSFKEGTREMTLIDGAILFQVPKGSGGATIRTVGVTAAITGTTGIGEFHPATSSRPQPFSKWLCLEGTFHLYLPNGQSVEVGPGKMVTTDGKSFSKVLTFDIAKLTSTSLFFTGFDQPLASMNLITLESQNQLASSLLATTTTNPLDPTKIVNVTSQALVAEQAQTSPSSSVSPPPPTPPPPTPPPTTPPPPTSTPSKFGTPTVITSPVPYLITSGTVIATDPSIITNGVTDYGKIYRGPGDDGAFSLWAFGSTSAFDTALGVDNFFADPTRFPIAVFKFQSLSLTGNPTIDTSNGGVTKLALIGVDGITSGPPGGTLTFTGLDLLALGTVNGSINLTSDISFQDISVLAMYARGADSNLILDSPISNVGDLKLGAEGSIQLTNPGTMNVGQFDATAGDDLTLQIGGSLLLNGKVRLDAIVLPGVTVASGANLTLNVTGDYTNNSATEFSRFAVTNQGHIGTGGNIAVDITGNLTATGTGSPTDFPAPGDVELLVQNTNAQIDNGGNLNLTVNGNVQVNGLIAYLQNYDETANPAGHIGTGGNIDIEIGGNLTANSYVDVFLNNRGGGTIDSGGNLTFNVGGALNIGTDSSGFSAEFIISTRYDDIGGNTNGSFIGSDVSLNFHAASVSMTGDLFGSGISNRGGSVINGNATATWDVPGDVNVQGTAQLGSGAGGASWFVLNDIPPDHQFTPPGGGTIHGNATLTLNVGGDLTIAGDGSMEIGNQRNFQEQSSRGGTIDSDATLNIAAANLSVGGELDIDINNRNNGTGAGLGGSIGGNAAINLNLSGNLTATGTDPNSIGTPGLASIGIFNESFVPSSPGGFIGGDASIAVTAASISTANNFNVQIANRGGGHIGGNALVNVAMGGNASAEGTAFFAILNDDNGFASGGGAIVGDAMVNVSATNITAAALFDQIVNFGGSIGSSANVGLSLTGDLTTQGDASFQILNNDDDSGSGPGTIGGDATVNVTANNISTGGSLFADIYNYSGGNIGGNAAINVNATSVSTADAFFARIDNDTGSTIGGAANVSVNVAGNVATTGDLVADILNAASNIGADANITFYAGGNIASGADTFFDVLGENGTIQFGSRVDVSAQDVSANGSLNVYIDSNNGDIGAAAAVSFLAHDTNSLGDTFFDVLNEGGTIGSSASVDVTANSISAGGILVADVRNEFGHIGTSADVALTVAGDIHSTGDTFFNILNDDAGSGPGTIGGYATISVSAGSITTGGSLSPGIDNAGVGNGGGTIGGTALVDVQTAGDMTVASLAMGIQNFNAGHITTAADINLTVGGDLTVTSDGELSVYLNNFTGGTIGTDANIFASIKGSVVAGDVNIGIQNQSGSIASGAGVTIDITGAFTTTAGDALFYVLNNDDGSGSGGGTIGGDATVNVSAASITTGGMFSAGVGNDGLGKGGGTIGGTALVDVQTAGDMSVASLAMGIQNFNAGSITAGAAVNLTVGGDLTVISDGEFNIYLNNFTGGSIGTDANIFASIAGNMSAGQIDVGIQNQDAGLIGGNADVTADITGGLFTTASYASFFINNSGGTIATDATLTLSANSISTGGSLSAVITNAIPPVNGFIGGTIGGDATIDVTANNITANSLLAQIDNTGGSIGANTEGGAMINMNVSNSATVTNDATVAIYGSDGAVGGAGININGGSYNVGGTFLSYIDGNGTIAFNNASAHADVLKAGVFGANGVLNVGGGMLSADSTLKLYAPGSNGQLNFMSNVTLGGNGLKILAANSITISNSVVVTISIGGPMADVYTNHANYTGFGGNGTTTGTFAGAGANIPQPLSSAPPFGPASPVKLTTDRNIPVRTGVPPQSAPARTPVPGGNITSRTRIPPPPPSNVLTGGKIADVRRASNVINVRSSDELLSLLDDAALGPGGKITIPPSKNASNSKNSNRTGPAGHLNAASRVNADRRAMDMRTASSSLMRRSPQ